MSGSRPPLERAGITGRPVSLLVFDIDGMKEVNDRFGHDTGDDALVAVAGALRHAVAEIEGVRRVPAGRRRVLHPARRSRRRERRTRGARGLDVASGLIRAAIDCVVWRGHDRSRRQPPQGAVSLGRRSAVCREARGRGRVSISASSERRPRRGGPSAVAALPRSQPRVAGTARDRARAARRSPGRADATERLEAVAAAAARSLDVVSWTISVAEPEAERCGPCSSACRGAEGDSGTESFVFDDATSYVVADYPLTEWALREESAFVVAADDPTADAGEVAILRKLRTSHVLGAGARNESGSYLLELYGDALTASLEQARSEIRLLVLEAVHGAGAPALGSSAGQRLAAAALRGRRVGRLGIGGLGVSAASTSAPSFSPSLNSFCA